jgi:hypothetical protein
MQAQKKSKTRWKKVVETYKSIADQLICGLQNEAILVTS